MKGKTWTIVLAVVVVAVIGVAVVLISIGQLAGADDEAAATPVKIASEAAAVTTEEPVAAEDQDSPTDAAEEEEASASVVVVGGDGDIVARVDGVEITRAQLEQAVAVDSAMNSLEGGAGPSEEEGLNRYVIDLLLIKGAGLEATEVEEAESSERLMQMLVRMGYSDEDVAQALEASGVTQADLTERVTHLILVDKAIQELSAKHSDLNAWVVEARGNADIWVDEAYTLAENPVPDDAAADAAAESGGEVGPQPGLMAPEIDLPTLDGEQVKLSDLRGQPVVINFWATWCPPCKAEMPALAAAAERYSERVTFLAVDVGESAEAVEAFLETLDAAPTILLDEGGLTTGNQYMVRGLPSTYFVDSDGRVRAVHVGPLTEPQIDEYLAPILPEGDEATGEPGVGAEVGMAAPDFSLRDADGVTFRLRDYRGKADVALVFYPGST
jgi:peroxiredoxin